MNTFGKFIMLPESQNGFCGGFTGITGQLFVYFKFSQADITIQGYFKKEKR
jgi:hypothetical protein